MVNQTFTSLAAALDYFNDEIVNLGTASSLGTGQLALFFSVATSPGNSFYASMLVGTAPINPLTITTAVSRKMHGGAGMFDISLPLVGAPGWNAVTAAVITRSSSVSMTTSLAVTPA